MHLISKSRYGGAGAVIGQSSTFGGHKTLILPELCAGTWGPTEADELLARDGREWRTNRS